MKPGAAFSAWLAARPPGVQAGVLMSISAFGYAASAALVRWLSDGGMPVFEIAFLRNVFGILFMGPWIVRVGLSALKTAHIGKHAVRGMFSAINVWCLYGALAFAPIADVAAITFMMPIFGSVLAVIVYREVVSGRQWTAVLIGFVGALIVIRPGFGDLNEGLLLAVGAVVAGSCVAMMIKGLMKYDSPDTVACYLFISHTLIGLIPAIYVWVTPDLYQIGACIALGWLGTVIQRTFNRGMAAADASVALPFNFSRLIWAAFFGWLCFSEVPDVWTWVGGAVIFAASIDIARHGGRGKAKPAETEKKDS
jgi:drug/metabolite transporter (DMT)-like permease